eukprot:8264943-Karenia_brevis.AAC.1
MHANKKGSAGAPAVREITNITTIMCGIHSSVYVEHQPKKFSSGCALAIRGHQPCSSAAGLHIVLHTLPASSDRLSSSTSV